ncbi:MAG: FtsQ-type POTRA domain-containing protein [Acidobacteriota bacterium]
MGAVAAPSDKRFRRAHVKPARRRKLAWRPVWVGVRAAALLALCAYGAWRGAALVLEAPALTVSRVVVSGHERLSRGEVLALVDGLQGRNILTVRLDEWRERVLASAWVADATLRRVLPATVEVVIRERTPLGIGRLGDRLYLVDAAGVIVDEYGPNYADLDLPIIDGLDARPSAGQTRVDEHRAALAARLLASLETKPALADRVSQIDVSEARDAVVILEGDGARLRLGDADFVDRLEGYLALAPALRERVADIDYVDLRFDERLYVRPRGKADK